LVTESSVPEISRVKLGIEEFRLFIQQWKIVKIGKKEFKEYIKKIKEK